MTGLAARIATVAKDLEDQTGDLITTVGTFSGRDPTADETRWVIDLEARRTASATSLKRLKDASDQLDRQERLLNAQREAAEFAARRA